MKRRRHGRLAAVLGAALLLALGGSCVEAPPPPPLDVGDPRLGKATIDAVGCGACHTIPGIDEADGLVGPPLTAWSQRSYIAGALPNTPDNLVAWVLDPQAIEPGTAMPDLGLTQVEARDVAAYLFSLD